MGAHKGRCFRDRRRTAARKERQAAAKAFARLETSVGNLKKYRGLAAFDHGLATAFAAAVTRGKRADG